MAQNRKADDRLYIDALLDQLNTRTDAPALRHLGADISAGALRNSIFRYARALASLGIGRGSLVALFATHCPDALAIRYAAGVLGAASMFLPAPATAERRATLLARIRPSLIVVFPQTACLVPVGTEARVVSVGMGPGPSALDALAKSQPYLPMPTRARPDDLAVIVSSGGTTGVPKGSCRSFARYSALVRAGSAANRRQLVNGPLAYLSQVLVDITLIGGGTVVLESRYDAARTLATIESERITDLFLVEPQLFEMMDHRDAGWRDLSSLRAITHVGGSAPAVLRQRAIRRLGPVLSHTYGASEMGLVSVLPQSAWNDAGNHGNGAPTCAGRLLDGVEIRFRRSDGTLARAGQCGTIEVKSPGVAQGYRNQPAETAEKFRDGWCVTGDVGFIDANGNVTVLGRAADVAEVGGIAIGPTQIETVLCRLPDVRYAVVVAAGNDAATSGWNAIVEPWSGNRLDAARCARAINTAFGTAVADKLSIVAADRVPLTEQGKVDRAAVALLVKRANRETTPDQYSGVPA